MGLRQLIAILLVAIVAMIVPRSASALIAPTPEARIGLFELREPGLVGSIKSRGLEVHRANSLCALRRASEPSLRWKGRPRDVISGVEVYDMRARWWVPEMGAFLSIDEYDFHDATSTLWGW